MSTLATMSAKSAEALRFYSPTNTIITLQKGSVRINMDSPHMDGYHWRDVVTLTENGQWITPRSGWMQIEVQTDALFQITIPPSLLQRWGMWIDCIFQRYKMI